MKNIQGFISSFPRKRDLLFLPPVIAFFVYQGVLKAGFITIDDPLLFQYLPALQLQNIFSFKENAYWFRPLLDLSYLIDYKIWLFDPFGFHLTNILLHSLNTILVALLSLELIEDNKKTAILASLLFAVHPVNLECVAWISARADLLATSALIISFLSVTLYLKSTKKSFLPLFCSLIAYGAALLVKETAIVFIPVIISYALFFPPKKGEQRYGRLLTFFFTFSLLTFVYFILRSHSISGEDQSGIIPELYYLHMIAPFSDDPDLVTAIFHALIPVLNSIGALGFYLKKMLLPYPLSMVIHSISEDAYVIFLLATLLIALICFCRRSLFLFFAFFLWLMPVFPVAFTNIIWTHYSERYLYLPGIFLLIAIANGINSISLKNGILKGLLVTLTLIVLFQFAVANIIHGRVWENSLSISKHIIKNNPQFSVPYEEIGIYHYSHGNFELAEKMFNQAIDRGAKYTPYYYLGLIYFKKGDEERGLSLLKKSEGRVAEGLNYFNKMGDYYLDKSAENSSSRTDLLKKARKYYSASYKKSKKEPATIYRLAMVHYKMGDYKGSGKFAAELTLGYPRSVWADAVGKYVK